MRSIRVLISLLAVAATFGSVGCGPAELADDAIQAGTREFRVFGVVREALAGGQVVIEHEEIAGYMPAMTMPFYVADAVEAGRLAIGDNVRFRFVVGESSRADRFEVIRSDDAIVPERPFHAAAPVARRLTTGDRVPEFSLVDQDNQPVTAADLDGGWTLVTFIFTRCPVPEFCPAMMFRYAEIQSRIQETPSLRDRVKLLALSLDPEYDRPEILSEYGAAFGLDSGLCRLVTGNAADVGALIAAFSVHSEKRAGTLDHTLCTALIGPDGRVLELWRGNGWKSDEIIAVLRDAVDSN